MPDNSISPERELLIACRFLCETHQAQAAVDMIWDWQRKRCEDKQRQRLLAEMKPTAKVRPFRVIEGGAKEGA